MAISDDVAARVREIEERTARARAEGLRRRERVVREEIAPRLGTVAVDGYGNFRWIHLDRDNVLVTTERVLAEAIVAALRNAESRARSEEFDG